MKFLLARHGNTFNQGEKAVWVGARTDMPLVPQGHIQATEIGKAISRAGLSIAHIYAGPLARTRETAQDVAANIGLPQSSITITEELREIDYGLWEGKTNDEIRDQYGSSVIDGWQTESIWPDGYNWLPGEDMITNRWNALKDRILSNFNEHDAVLAISSNGIFKVISKAFGISNENSKMATGSMSLIEIRPVGHPIIHFWNSKPEIITS